MNANGNQKVYDYINASDGGFFNIPHSKPVILNGGSKFDAVVYNSVNFYDTTYMFFHSSFNGGAIYCNGNNLTIINSSFVNNFASCGGGIYIDGANSKLINLFFFNNTAEEGGAIFNSGKNTYISDSEFNLNHAQYGAHSICSYDNINIQKCNFNNNSQSCILCGNWHIDNMNLTYFNSFVKFGDIDFKFNLTHIQNDCYELKITFGLQLHCHPDAKFCEDYYGYSVNKKFCLNIDGKVYNLQTDKNSQANLYLNLSNGVHDIEVYNPISNLGILKSFKVSDFIIDNNTTINKNSEKSFSIIVAKNKVFNKKLKTKLYGIVLKSKKGKMLKNTWVTLKINGKLFKAKTNNKGKATFKIKINKKGKSKAKITFKGDNNYNKCTKKVKIIVK